MRSTGLHRGRAAVGQYIDGAVGPDAHVPNAGLQMSQQRFFRHDPVVYDHEPIKHHGAQATDEDAASPLRKDGAGIESEA